MRAVEDGGWKWAQVCGSGWKWTEVNGSERNWTELGGSGRKRTKLFTGFRARLRGTPAGHLLVNLGFWISRFPILDISFYFFQIHFGKSGGEISRNNNKGVLDRPWTKWRVLFAISSTLKFQFTVNLAS